MSKSYIIAVRVSICIVCDDEVEVIDTADSDRKLQYKELLHIIDRKPMINKQFGSQSDYNITTWLITKYDHLK